MIWFFTQDITDVIKNVIELNYLMDAILNNILCLFVRITSKMILISLLNNALLVTLKFLLPKRWGVLILKYFPNMRMRRSFIG